MAVKEAELAAKLSWYQDAAVLDTAAMAFYADGQIKQAIKRIEDAVALVSPDSKQYRIFKSHLWQIKGEPAGQQHN